MQELAGIDFFHAKEAWTKERRPQVEAFVRDRLAMLERALGRQDYLEGRFTVGDLMMADVLRILRHTDLLDAYPSLKAYTRALRGAPGLRARDGGADAGVRAGGVDARRPRYPSVRPPASRSRW